MGVQETCFYLRFHSFLQFFSFLFQDLRLVYLTWNTGIVIENLERGLIMLSVVVFFSLINDIILNAVIFIQITFPDVVFCVKEFQEIFSFL